MPLTLASLAHHSALKLTVLAGGDRLERRGALGAHQRTGRPGAVSGGRRTAAHHRPEAGHRGPGGAGGVRPAARRGRGGRARVRRRAWGTTRCRPRWSTAAAEAGLPLLGVPRATPFIAISKAVSASIAADQYQAVTAGLRGPARADQGRAGPRRHRRPAGPARRPPRRLGRALRRLGRGAGRRPRLGRPPRRPAHRRDRPARATCPRPRAPPSPGPRAPRTGSNSSRWAPAAARAATSRSAPRSASRTAARYVVHAAVALLTLSLEQSRALQDAQGRLAAALLRMLLAGRAGPRAQRRRTAVRHAARRARTAADRAGGRRAHGTGRPRGTARAARRAGGGRGPARAGSRCWPSARGRGWSCSARRARPRWPRPLERVAAEDGLAAGLSGTRRGRRTSPRRPPAGRGRPRGRAAPRG